MKIKENELSRVLAVLPCVRVVLPCVRIIKLCVRAIFHEYSWFRQIIFFADLNFLENIIGQRWTLYTINQLLNILHNFTNKYILRTS